LQNTRKQRICIFNVPSGQNAVQYTGSIYSNVPANKYLFCFRKYAYKGLYNELRNQEIVRGEKIVLPKEIVDFIRAVYPDADAGSYDYQHEDTTRMPLEMFMNINWPKCRCI
jgi:hypothetical protein